MIYDKLINEIGQLLLKSAPENASKVIAQLEYTPDMDVCSFLFDFYDRNNELNWYMPASSITGLLSDEVKKLRQYCIDNNLTNGYPAWIGCIVTVDIENLKISIEFKYEPFIEK